MKLLATLSIAVGIASAATRTPPQACRWRARRIKMCWASMTWDSAGRHLHQRKLF
jgi:hypothetical protein